MKARHLAMAFNAAAKSCPKPLQPLRSLSYDRPSVGILSSALTDHILGAALSTLEGPCCILVYNHICMPVGVSLEWTGPKAVLSTLGVHVCA